MEKTNKRIKALENPEAYSRVGPLAPTGSVSVPDIDQLRSIKEFVFQLESTEPDVKVAVEHAIKKLEALHSAKGYKFSAQFGVK